MNPHEHKLHYPWPDVPALGTWTTLRPGLHWVRMPLPFALDHINLWALADEIDGRAGWTVIDSGISNDVTRQAWERIFDGAFAGGPLVRLLCTHFHPDHFGLAWWLVDGGDRARWTAPLWMSATEYAFGRFLSLGGDQTTGGSVARHFGRNGLGGRAIVDTISVIGLQPQGITVKGDTLFYVMDGFQGDDEKIYAIDLNTENILFSFHVPETPGVRQNPRGLAWDGTYFWLMAEPVGAASGRQLFKYDLSGSGTPEITLPITTINFPNTTVGNTYNYNLTIYSTGTTTLTIDSITISGNSYTFNPLTFPINIPAGSSYNVVVNFTPLQYAYYQGLLKIYCNDPVSLVNNINLRGQGVLSGARIGLSATSHNFGNVWVGEEGIAYWKFKIISIGDQTLQISDLHFHLPEFTYSAPALPFSIPSTDTIELTAYFYPTQIGTYNDTLKITNNDLTNSIAKIIVQGTGNFSSYNYGYMFWEF